MNGITREQQLPVFSKMYTAFIALSAYPLVPVPKGSTCQITRRKPGSRRNKVYAYKNIDLLRDKEVQLSDPYQHNATFRRLKS